jgi:hypothetical protein
MDALATARLKKQRREARQKRAAAAKLAAARRAAEKREAARREAQARQLGGTARDGGEANKAMPFVATAAIAALIILGLALVPAYAVPWHRMSIALQDHREQFAVVGGMTLLGAGLFFALTFLGQ